MSFNISDHIQPDKNGRKVLRWESFINLNRAQTWSSLLENQSLEISLEGIDIFSHDGVV